MVNMELISLSIGGVVYIIQRLSPVTNKIIKDVNKVKTSVDGVITAVNTISDFINAIIITFNKIY